MANDTSSNASLFQPLVTAAQYAAYENSVARQIVTVFDAPANTGKSLVVPTWNSITAQIITDEGAATAKNTASDSVTIPLTEHVVYHRVTDMLRDSAYSNVIAQLGDQSGRAIAESLDTQAFAKFSSLGGTATAITVANFGKDDIMDRVADLRTNKLSGPFVAVLHPKVAAKLKKSLTAVDSYTASGMTADNILQNYFITQFAGCQVIESPLVPYNSGTGVATCAVFAPQALGHAMRGAIALETQRQASARATDIVLTAVAGAEVLNDAYGFIMNVDLVA